MQLKSRILILLSVLTLIALIAIQGYLIYNSYELKQKTITIDARNAIAKIYNTPEIDSIAWLYRNDFLIQLEDYESGKISNSELLKNLRSKGEEINPGFLQAYNNGLKQFGDDFDVKFKKIVTEISVSDSLGVSKTLYPLKNTDTIILLGEDFPQPEGLLINNSTWQKDHEIDKGGTSEVVDLNFKTSIFMSVSNWNALIVKELSGLLIMSCILFLFVVSLLYYSIQNLFKQKRVADIKTDFINNITHELKTPLSTLTLATKTFTKGYQDNDDKTASEAVDVINRQNVRLQKLIDQVLKSSLGYREIKLSSEEFNANLFLNELLDDFELSITDSLVINRKLENTGVLMIADTFYLSTAIINILNNAIKYGGNILTVFYDLDRVDNTHRITISDNGIGISKKYQKYIFDKFYRISEKDRHTYKGLGLGLYYTKQIISAHNGNITVESEEKKGSSFTIKIPIVS